MANNLSQNHASESFGGVIEVSVGGVIDVDGPLIGWSIIDGLKTIFSASGKMKKGDYFMDRSRELLRRHLHVMEAREQDTIRIKFEDVRDTKNELENFSGSRFQRFLGAEKYLRNTRQTYRLVKSASQRGIDARLMDQISVAIQQRGGGAGIVSIASIPRDPFTDSHAISTLTDVTVNDLERVEMSTYVAGDTGEGAVVLDLFNQDQSVQHVVATFPTEAFSGERTDSGVSQPIALEAPVALSLHREDGTMPRFVDASSLVASTDERVNEEVERRSLISMTSTEINEMFERANLTY